MIQVQCPGCEKSYQVSESAAGGQTTCKSCGQTFTLSTHLDGTRYPVAKRPDQSAIGPRQPSGPAAPIRKLGQYVIKRKLGAGGMGEVYLAHDEALQRDVAIKVLPAAIAKDKELLERFLHEARSAAKLDHPNAVAVYQAGVYKDRAYIAMQFVDGESLDKTVAQQGALAWRAATRVIRDAAAGLAAAHELGIIHRDVKPANLMKNSKGVTKVVDFGLARDLTVNEHLTQPGSVLGTPAYMAPEQWTHEPVDPRTDLYALACTYYFLLTGKTPFSAPTVPQLAYQHRHEAVPDPRLLVPAIPEGVCRVLARGASKLPTARHQSAGELVAELDALLSSPPALPQFEVRTGTGAGRKPKLTTSLATVLRAPHRVSMRVVTAVCAAVTAILFGVVLYIVTNTGTIKIELSDPAAKVDVEVNGETVILKTLDGPLTLRAGKNNLKITGANFETVTKEFTVKRGDNPVAHIELVKKSVSSGRGKEIDLGSRSSPRAASQGEDSKAALMQAFQKVVKPGETYKGISDWGNGKTTKSELLCLKSSATNSEWEFVFLEPSINNTPVPFREKWTGELINDVEGVYLRLTRFDGKARHRYFLNDVDELLGKDEGAAWTFRFKVKKHSTFPVYMQDMEWLARATGKRPVPPPGPVTAARTILRNSYRAELAGAKSEDRVKLAKDLIERSSQAKEGAQQFAMLDLGRELAAEGEDLATAMNACLEISKRFLQQDPIQLKASTLIKEADASHSSPAFLDQLVIQVFTVGFEAWANDDHQTALKLARVAATKAKLGDWPSWTYQAAFLEDEAKIGAKAWDRVKTHAGTLATTPGDPRANAEMGKYLCLIKNEWVKGLPMLALSEDAMLRSLAEKENGKPAERGHFVALADAWWDAGTKAPEDEQFAFRRRAKRWYLKALSLGSMEEKAELAKKAQLRIDAVARRPIALYIQVFGVEGYQFLDISQDGAATTGNSHGTRTIRINHLEWNGNVTDCQNRGAQRLYPDGLDFSTAMPLHQWLGDNGAMFSASTSQGIGLGTLHPPAGSADFSWLVYVEDCGYALPNRFGPLWNVRYYHWDSKIPSDADNYISTDKGWKQVTSGTPVDEYTAEQISFRSDAPPYSDVPPSSPSAKVKAEYFAMTATSTWDLPKGTYEFHGFADDGMRVFVDGKPVWENWLFRAEGRSKPIVIAKGTHEIKVDYYQMWGPMLLRFYAKRIGD